jgi:hypothetical protein
MWLAVGLIVLIAAIGWFMRRGAVDSVSAPGPRAQEAEPEAEEEGDIQELAVTSDGALFIPDGYSVRIMPLDPDEALTHQEDIESGLFALSREERLQLVARRGKPGQALSAGDFTAARIQRGAADVVPWVLETLGRDGEYIPFPFETDEGARAALAILQSRRIVRRPLDEEGREIPASPEDFEEARRRYDDSWRALALEREPGEEPGPPYSDRR